MISWIHKMKLRKNDIVRVSGLQSLQMKVLGIKEESTTCYWFDHTNNICVFRFPTTSLEITTDDKVFSYYSTTGKTININKQNSNFDSFKTAILENSKIRAIKQLRNMTGLGLKEAKDDVEHHMINWTTKFMER